METHDEFVLEVQKLSNDLDFEKNKEELKKIRKEDFQIIIILLKLGFNIENSIKSIYYLQLIENETYLTKMDAIKIYPKFLAIVSFQINQEK